MNDLISRTAAIEAFMGKPPEYYHTSYIVGEINCLPAVDAAPVVHGEWVEEPDRVNHYHCSNCGVVWGVMSKAMKYCPNYAAKMMNSPMWDVEGERRDGDA